jgi:hypothetical protein
MKCFVVPYNSAEASEDNTSSIFVPKSKPSKKQARSRYEAAGNRCLLATGLITRLFFDSEDGGNILQKSNTNSGMWNVVPEV